MKFLLIAMMTAGLFGQTTGAPWLDVSGNIGASNLSNPLVAKPNFQTVAGAPTALNCTAGKDLAYNSVAGTWHVCTVTGTPGTWTQIAVNPPTGTIVGTTDSQTLTNKTVDGVSPTTFGFLDPTSSLQTQLNSKLGTVQNGGTPVTNRATINFINGTNATVTCVDNAGSGRTDCTVAATAGSAAPVFPANAQTSTYQLLAADFANFKVVAVASGTFTITGVASGSQPASGQGVWIVNYGSGVVTFARSGQNINGGTTSITIPAGSQQSPTALFVVSDGTNYIAQPFGGASGGGGGGVSYCAPASASGTTYTCAPSPALTAYSAGTTLAFVPDVTGAGGAMTVNASSLGAKSIKLSDGTTNPGAGVMVASRVYELIYDGTVFRLAPARSIDEQDDGTCTTTKTIDANAGLANGISFHRLTLGGNCTVSWTQPAVGVARVQLTITQGASAFTAAWTSTLWPSGIAPVITTTNAAVDVIACYLNGSTVKCTAAQNFQ